MTARSTSRPRTPTRPPSAAPSSSSTARSAWRSWPSSGRRSIALRDDGVINDATLRTLERELDLDELQTEA